MDEQQAELHKLHIIAGLACGEARTCGNKINYYTIETAIKAAGKVSEKLGKELEAYPCAFCEGWHIGRKMSFKELSELTINYE